MRVENGGLFQSLRTKQVISKKFFSNMMHTMMSAYENSIPNYLACRLTRAILHRRVKKYFQYVYTHLMLSKCNSIG
jgi:hypothetical protein